MSTETHIRLEDRTSHINEGTTGIAALYVVNGVPYVRTASAIVGLGVSPTTDGAKATPTTMVQTYSTADATLSAYTASNQSAAYTTTGATTDIASKADLNTLRAAYETLRALTEDLAKFTNSLIDTLQAQGVVN